MIHLIDKTYAVSIIPSDLSIRLSTTAFDVTSLVAIFVNLILYVAGVLAFLFLVYSGILCITSGGNPDSAKKAQRGLIDAIIGIIIISLALVILRVANNLVLTGTV